MSDNSTTPRKKPPAAPSGRQPKTPGYKPFWHSRGGWTIKINGKGVYLGRDTKKAELKFREQVLPNIRTGHAPNADRLTLGKDLTELRCNLRYDIQVHEYPDGSNPSAFSGLKLAAS